MRCSAGLARAGKRDHRCRIGAALGGGLPVRACERLAEIADVGCR